MNLHEIPVGQNAPEEVNVVIEIPQGSSNKVEYNPEWAAFVLTSGGDRSAFDSAEAVAEAPVSKNRDIESRHVSRRLNTGAA